MSQTLHVYSEVMNEAKSVKLLQNFMLTCLVSLRVLNDWVLGFFIHNMEILCIY